LFGVNGAVRYQYRHKGAFIEETRKTRSNHVMTETPNVSAPVIPYHAPLPVRARVLFASTLRECSIKRAMERSMRIATSGDGVRVLFGNDGQDPIASVDLTRCRHLRILAVGKAAGVMLEAVLSHLALPPGIDLQGVVIAPSLPSFLPEGFQFFPGGHPLPNAASFAGAHAVVDLLAAIPPSSTLETVCLFLLSGGASAMMELPLDPAISLDDTIASHRALIHSAASIAEINCVRKHFSAVKGGRLAIAARAAACVSLFVSDVPAGHLDALGSGPTVPDTTTLDDCRAVLARYDLLPLLPASVQRFFLDPAVPETPKPGEFTPHAVTLLDSDRLAAAARRHAEQLGFHAVVDNTCDDWDCLAAADYLLGRLRTLRKVHPRVCLISVGEITVSIPNNRLTACSIGGRNQHFALYAATRLQTSDGSIAVLSAGSDGIDGNSPFAGAVVDQRTLENPRLRSEAQMALIEFRSTSLLRHVGATISTGPTGNNLRDLRLLLAE
jgi:glycerate 2-kinase